MGGVLLDKIGWGCAAGFLKPLPYFTKICDFPYPISALIKNLIPYFSPDLEINTLFSLGARRVTGACDKLLRHMQFWHKRLEMVLSPNDEEVASSQKHTSFKARVHKPCPISDPIS